MEFWHYIFMAPSGWCSCDIRKAGPLCRHIGRHVFLELSTQGMGADCIPETQNTEQRREAILEGAAAPCSFNQPAGNKSGPRALTASPPWDWPGRPPPADRKAGLHLRQMTALICRRGASICRDSRATAAMGASHAPQWIPNTHPRTRPASQTPLCSSASTFFSLVTDSEKTRQFRRAIIHHFNTNLSPVRRGRKKKPHPTSDTSGRRRRKKSHLPFLSVTATQNYNLLAS